MIFLTRVNGHDIAGAPVCLKGCITLKVLRRMKLTILLLTAFFLQVSAKGISQNVNLQVKDASLEQVFKLIERQTGYGFLYTAKTLQGSEKVNLSVKNTPLKQVLQQLLYSQGMTFSMPPGGKTIVVKKQGSIANRAPLPGAPATAVAPPVLQLVEIKGVVKSEDSGEPLVGATITVKEQKQQLLPTPKVNFLLMQARAQRW